MKVLVVDDSDAIRRRVTSCLSELEGVALVAEAADGGGALRHLGTLAPDLVLLDLSLPGPSGIEVLSRMKATAPSPIVIVLTNHASAPYRAACMERGADYFFDKSKQFDRALDVVRGLGAARAKRG